MDELTTKKSVINPLRIAIAAIILLIIGGSIFFIISSNSIIKPTKKAPDPIPTVTKVEGLSGVIAQIKSNGTIILDVPYPPEEKKAPLNYTIILDDKTVITAVRPPKLDETADQARTKIKWDKLTKGDNINIRFKTALKLTPSISGDLIQSIEVIEAQSSTAN